MKKVLGNFYIKMAVSCAVGIVLMGIGSGICFMEFSGLKVVNAEEETTTDENVYIFPQNGEPVYIPFNVDIMEDSETEKGNFVLTAEHSRGKSIFNDIQKEYMDDNDSIRQVYVLDEPFFTSEGGDDFEHFQSIISHLKDKQIYVYSYKMPEYTIKVNPEDREKLVQLNKHPELTIEYEYTLEDGVDDISEIPDDNDYNIAEDIDMTVTDETEETAVTEVTTAVVPAPETTVPVVQVPDTSIPATPAG